MVQSEKEVARSERGLTTAFGENAMISKNHNSELDLDWSRKSTVSIDIKGADQVEFNALDIHRLEDGAYAEQSAIKNPGVRVRLVDTVDGVTDHWYHRGWFVSMSGEGETLFFQLYDSEEWEDSLSHPSEKELTVFEVETDVPWKDYSPKFCEL